jgi:NADP-dependent 3-hydroxy acid dehydrogenase YdfG
MSNIATLQNAGLIPQNANFNPADTQTIESLSQDEVNALISISQKLTPDFIARNFGGGAGVARPAAPGAPARQSLGIVF